MTTPPVRSREPKLLAEATLSNSAVSYHILGITVVLAVSIIGIPLLVIAVPISFWYWTRYYANLRVTLTARELKVQRGILNKEEKTIPLEQITDLAIYQGPIMRKMGLKGIRVETAGQSSGATALVTVVGIEDTDAFRDMVLNQRDRLRGRSRDDEDDDQTVEHATHAGRGSALDPAAAAAIVAALEDIRVTLHEIRDKLNRA